MNERHKPTQPTESVEQGLEEHFERTDKKHSEKQPRELPGLGELQRAPKRAMREANKTGDKKKD